MSVKDDLTSAATHVAGLRHAVAALREDLGTTIDVQRLRDDVARLADDVDLLARGRRHSAAASGWASPARSCSSPTTTTTRPSGRTPRTRASDRDGRTEDGRHGATHGRRRTRPGDHRRGHAAPGPLVAPAAGHGRRARRVVALRHGAGGLAALLLGRRLPLPHAVRVALPVHLLRAGLEPLRHAVRRLPAAGALRHPHAAVPAAVPADLLLLPQGLLPVVLAVTAGLRGRRAARALHRRDAVPAGPAERPPLLLLRRRAHLPDQHVRRAGRLPRQGTAASASASATSSCWPMSFSCGPTRSPATPAAASSAAGSTTSPSTRSGTGCGARCPGSTATTWAWRGPRSRRWWSPTPTSRSSRPAPSPT